MYRRSYCLHEIGLGPSFFVPEELADSQGNSVELTPQQIANALGNCWIPSECLLALGNTHPLGIIDWLHDRPALISEPRPAPLSRINALYSDQAPLNEVNRRSAIRSVIAQHGADAASPDFDDKAPSSPWPGGAPRHR